MLSTACMPKLRNLRPWECPSGAPWRFAGVCRCLPTSSRALSPLHRPQTDDTSVKKMVSASSAKSAASEVQALKAVLADVGVAGARCSLPCARQGPASAFAVEFAQCRPGGIH